MNQARGNSATGDTRKQVLQQQEGGGFPFMKEPQNQDDKRKAELEKQKEYRMQLQQQMALKQQQLPPKRRGTSQGQPQQLSQENIHYPQQQMPGQYQQMVQFQSPQMPQMNYPAFQEPIMPQAFPPQHQFQHMSGLPPAYIRDQPIMPMAAGMDYQPMAMAQFHQPPPHQPEPQFTDNYQLPYPAHTEPSKQDMAAQQRQKQEEYRRELQMQVKLKEEQKKQRDLEQQQYEQRIEQNVPHFHQNNAAPPISGGDQMAFQQNFVRQRTDVSKQGDVEEEQQRMLKQQRQREELKKQMEENQRKKDEERLRKKREDEMEEAKLAMERDQMNQQVHQELVKEGKRNPNDYPQEKKKNVRRDLFEPSQDNPAFKAQRQASLNQAFEERQMEEPVPMAGRREDLFGDHGVGSQLPINQRQDLFSSDHQEVQLPVNRRGEPFERQKPSWEPALPINQEPIQVQPMPSQFQPLIPRSQPFEYQPPLSANSAQFSNQDSQMHQKMMEEQSKMLVMYQQALHQILEFKTQYFEQVMQMRETIVKEREQLMEYEKVKSQQNQEIQSLQAVYNQLGSILNNNSAPRQPDQMSQQPGGFLNPQVQNNLNSLIMNQKEQILRMSQGNPLQALQQQIPQQHVPPQQYPYQQQQQQFPQYEARAQSQQQRTQQNTYGDQNNVLEQSLSSDTKLVNIPLNKLGQPNPGPEMFQTWSKEQLAQQNPQMSASASGLQNSLQGSSHFINQFSSTPQKNQVYNTNNKLWQSRPQTSQPPETIEELPKEEDEQMNSLKHQKAEDDKDLNNRSSFEEEKKAADKAFQEQKETSYLAGTGGGHGTTQTNPLVNTNTIHENLMLIERMIQQNPQAATPIGMQTGFSNKPNANQSASSFYPYNNTLQQQKMQEQSQMEELQKQLHRIFGSTLKSDNDQALQLQVEMEERPTKTQPNFNPLKIAAENEKMQFMKVEHEEQDLFMQSQINVANSMTGTQGMKVITEQARQRFTNNNFPQVESSHIEIQDEAKQKIFVQQQDPNQNVQGSSEEEEEEDVWNDPDLIPPPVVQYEEGDQSYEAFEVHNNMAPGLFQSEIAQDKTIKGLQMFSPPVVNQSDSQLNIGDLQDSQAPSQLEESKTYEQPVASHFPVQDNMSDRSLTKKERDMMEVQKLIQQATNTTHSLFENSDNFKFRIRSENKGGMNKGSKKNIRVGDPFKQADGKGQQKEEIGDVGSSKDQQIMDNLDKIISDLQGQQQRQSHQVFQTQQQESQFRPISANQPTGKYAQMALDQGPDQQLGKFAQMAIKQDTQIDSQDIADLNQKFRAPAPNFDPPQAQQILRPVSGKSNSTRYQIGSAQSQRRKDLPQQPFNDDENDCLDQSKKGGFNIAETSMDQQTFRPQEE